MNEASLNNTCKRNQSEPVGCMCNDKCIDCYKEEDLRDEKTPLDFIPLKHDPKKGDTLKQLSKACFEYQKVFIIK